MKEFLYQLGSILKIDNMNMISEEKLQELIFEHIEKQYKIEKQLFNLFEEISFDTEIGLRVISLVNLFIKRIYQEEDKKLLNFISYALNEISRLLPIENISFMEKHQRFNYLVLKAASGKIKLKDFEIKNFPIESSIAGVVYNSGKYIYCPNCEKDPRYNKELSKLPIKSLLCVPLKDKDKIIGVLNFSHHIENAFNESAIFLLVFLTDFFFCSFNFIQRKI